MSLHNKHMETSADGRERERDGESEKEMRVEREMERERDVDVEHQQRAVSAPKIPTNPAQRRSALMHFTHRGGGRFRGNLKKRCETKL